MPSPKVAAMLTSVVSATDRLLDTLDALVAQDDLDRLLGPSLLPGWTRAHVVTHLARNADGLRNVLAAGRTGRAVPMYPSPELRAADIDAGAGRPLELLVPDVRAASERLAVELDCFPEDRWDADAGVALNGQPFTANVVPRLRVCEVEAHHVDLDLGYGFDRSPADAAAAFLDQVPARFAGSAVDPGTLVAVDLDRRWTVGTPPDGGLVVEGTAGALLAWALGRDASGAGLATTGTLPESPGWR
jgi:maleylpyruvate isomerase